MIVINNKHEYVLKGGRCFVLTVILQLAMVVTGNCYFKNIDIKSLDTMRATEYSTLNRKADVCLPVVADNHFRSSDGGVGGVCMNANENYIAMEPFNINMMPHFLQSPLKDENVHISEMIFASIKIRHLIDRYQELQAKSLEVARNFALPVSYRDDRQLKNKRLRNQKIDNKVRSVRDQYRGLNKIMVAASAKADSGYVFHATELPTRSALSIANENALISVMHRQATNSDTNREGGLESENIQTGFFKSAEIKKSSAMDLTKDKTLPWPIRFTLLFFRFIARNKIEVFISGLFILMLILMLSSSRK